MRDKENKDSYESMMEKEKRIVVENFLPYLDISLILLFIFVIVKMKRKIRSFISGCHKHIVQIFILKILMRSFKKRLK